MRKSPSPTADPALQDVPRLVHDLRVHQIELEMQNDELRLAQEQLEEARAKYFDLFNQAPVGYLTTGEQGTILEANHTAACLLGVEGSQLVTQPLTRFIVREDQDIFYLMRRRLAEEHVPQSCELRMTQKDGPPIWVHIDAIEARAGDRREDRGWMVLSDITSRVRGEESRALLERQVHQGQRLEALGTLAGGIAHDFNNILGTIIGNVELARQDVGPDHPASVSLAEIRKASDRAKGLVAGILAFGRQQLQHKSVVELRPVVEDAVALLRPTLPAGVELSATFDAEAPTVLADSLLIHQVLINLCTNAWQALGGRGGRVEIRLDGVTLDAEAAAAAGNLRPGRFACLHVSDNGVGMSASTIEHIFEPFFTTKPVDEGTGLGLSVVYGIVQTHRGAVTVSSRLGEGTTCSVYLPAYVPAAEVAKPVVAPEAKAKPLPAAAGQHVLYLDDEEPLVFLVTRLLERVGYRVSGYTRVDEALAALRADPGQFDLVVTDMNMPGSSGIEVAREVARLRPDLPVALASGFITEEMRAAAAAAGVRELIFKPDTVEGLCAVVQRLAGPPKVVA